MGQSKKKMPAAMEKKYLSYSVRALRPNGGVDPMPRQMRREALQDSIHGFTLDDPVQPRTLVLLYYSQASS